MEAEHLVNMKSLLITRHPSNIEGSVWGLTEQIIKLSAADVLINDFSVPKAVWSGSLPDIKGAYLSRQDYLFTDLLKDLFSKYDKIHFLNAVDPVDPYIVEAALSSKYMTTYLHSWDGDYDECEKEEGFCLNIQPIKNLAYIEISRKANKTF